MKTHTHVSLALLILLVSCQQPTALKIDDYFKYLIEPSNGLYQLRRVNQFEIRARYLPVDYLIYKDYQEQQPLQKINIDSLKNLYKGSLTFLLQVAPNIADGHEFDVMTQTVATIPEFKEQSFHLNFLMEENLTLKINDKEFKPVLVELENTYELTKHRNFMVTYALDSLTVQKDYESMDFVFQDNIFGTGIHHFLFEQKAIQNTPTIKL